MRSSVPTKGPIAMATHSICLFAAVGVALSPACRGTTTEVAPAPEFPIRVLPRECWTRYFP